MGLRVFRVALSSWAENLVLHGGNCWSKNGFSPWSCVNGTSGGSSKCGMGCDYACCYHSIVSIG